MKCPYCDTRLRGDYPDKTRYFNCEPCRMRFYLEDDGTLVDVFHRQPVEGGLECENCGQSLIGGEYVAAWENGNNPDAYIKCPHCGNVNFLS